VYIFDQFCRWLRGGDQQRAVSPQQLVDRLQAIPGPRFHAFAQGIIRNDGDVIIIGLIPGEILLELFLGIGHDGKLLGRDAVTFGRIAIAPEGDADFPFLSGGQDHTTADVLGQGFLEDAAVYDFH
jgi:hypothetical protein